MTEPTQFDKVRYSMYSAILFYVVALTLNSKLIVNAVVFGILVFGMMQIKGI